jgi:hypothetical protein
MYTEPSEYAMLRAGGRKMRRKIAERRVQAHEKLNLM